MKRFVLISLSSKMFVYQTNKETIAVNPNENSNISYAKSFNTEEIFLVKPNHGVMKIKDDPDVQDAISSPEEFDKIINDILLELKEAGMDFENDEMIFLADEKYIEKLSPHFKKYRIYLLALANSEYN